MATLAQFDAEEILRAAFPQALNLDPAAKIRLKTLIAEGAMTLAQEPGRVSEAIRTMHLLAQHLQGHPQLEGSTAITVQQINSALGKLCPAYPIC